MGLIYAVFQVTGEEETVKRYPECVGRVDGIEFRIDYKQKIDNKTPKAYLEKLLKDDKVKKLRKLVTNRSPVENGNFIGDEDERISSLYEALRLGADMADIEFAVKERIRVDIIKYAQEKSKSIILSMHDFNGCPEEVRINELTKFAKQYRNVIPKIAFKVKDEDDKKKLDKLKEKLKKRFKDYILIGMDLEGQDSRLFFGSYPYHKGHGSYPGYFPLTKQEATAPGQVTLDEYLEFHIQKCITNKVDLSADRLVALIGKNASTYSKSPNIWNAAFKALGINADYVCFDVPNEKNLKFLAGLLKKYHKLKGFDMTTPYKENISQFSDGKGKTAVEAGGRINIIKRANDGKLVGHNTGIYGFAKSLESAKIDLLGKNVLVLGAGSGSSYAVLAALSEIVRYGSIFIINRTEELKKIYNEVKLYNASVIKAESIGQISDRLKDLSAVINATSVGNLSNLPEYSPLAKADEKTTAEENNKKSLELASKIPKEALFYDLIYDPEETTFLRHGRLAGHETINGKSMLLYQEVKGFEILFQEELRGQALARSAVEAMFGEMGR